MSLLLWFRAHVFGGVVVLFRPVTTTDIGDVPDVRTIGDCPGVRSIGEINS